MHHYMLHPLESILLQSSINDAHITDINVLVSGDRGPCSKYDISIPEGDFKGKLEVVWEAEPFKV